MPPKPSTGGIIRTNNNVNRPIIISHGFNTYPMTLGSCSCQDDHILLCKSVPIDACLYFQQPCHRSVCTRRSTHCYVNLFLMMPVYTFSNPVIGQSVPGGAHIVTSPNPKYRLTYDRVAESKDRHH
jgi:hypothetical protein